MRKKGQLGLQNLADTQLLIAKWFDADISFYKVDATSPLPPFSITLTSVSFDWCECVVLCLATRSDPFNKLILSSRVSENRENYDQSFIIGKIFYIWELTYIQCVMNIFNVLITNDIWSNSKVFSSCGDVKL